MARGHSLIHASGMLEGNSYIWPDPELSTSGRKLKRVVEFIESGEAASVECDL